MQHYVAVESKCEPVAFQNELDQYKFSKNHTILQNTYNYTIDTKVEDVICTCTTQRFKAKKILPIAGDDLEHQICVYPQCPRVLFTAFMRQLRQLEKTFNPTTVKAYHKHCDYLFKNKILPLLIDFNYDIDEWMTHITTYNKQLEVLPFYNALKEFGKKFDTEWLKNNYSMFAKAEKQKKEAKKMAKCRAISAAPPNVKWITGPIVYALEKIFESFDGYKVNNYDNNLHSISAAKTWQEQELSLDLLYKKGLDLSIDIDGSAWDSTQTYHMKYLINLIYNWLADNNKITHVDTELFRQIATDRYRKLTAKAYVDNKTVTIFSAIVDGTTFSGSMDTTFANTLTNLSVAEFCRKQAGLRSTQWKHSCSGDDYKGHISSEHFTTLPIQQIITDTWEGLGLLPKYVLVGPYTNITFCSTNVIQYTENGERLHKIVRQPDRLYPLTHYSIEALSYSTGQLKTYYQDLAKGMSHWATGLPWFEDYITAFKHYDTTLHCKAEQIGIKGKSKMRFGDYSVTKNTNYEIEQHKQRTSNRLPPQHAVYEFLLEKYQITRSDVKQHKHDLIFEKFYDPMGPNSAN